MYVGWLWIPVALLLGYGMPEAELLGVTDEEAVEEEDAEEDTEEVLLPALQEFGAMTKLPIWDGMTSVSFG